MTTPNIMTSVSDDLLQTRYRTSGSHKWLTEY